MQANPLMNVMQEQTRVLDGEPMTINGTINKTFLLLIFTFISACYTYSLALSGFTDKVSILMRVGVIASIILAIIIIFFRNALFILTPMYAVAEGLVLGGISAIYAQQFAGIVTQAVLATFATLGVMLALFRLGIIRCDDKFRSIIHTATFSIFIIYLIQFVASFFSRSIPQIFTASPIGIIFSVVVVLIASLNLILDFDFIKRGTENLLPQKYEWYGAFGLIVTLIWLYLEILKLLAKTQSRN